MRETLERLPDGAWTVRRLDADGEVLSEVSRAWAVSDLCCKLGKSRRQVYRYLKDGWLVPVGKYLGEWVVDASGLQNLAGGRLRAPGRIPESTRGLFQEYDFDRLHPLHDSHVILERILELGGSVELRWLVKQYSRSVIRSWLTREGWRLSPRSRAFWGLLYGVGVPARRPFISVTGRA